MSYIGNGRTLVVLGTNVRDDITPTYSNPLRSNGTKKEYPQDGPFDQKEFELSQEVPGGYEQNIFVVRQKYITDSLIESTTEVDIVVTPESEGGVTDTFKIVCSNPSIAAALSIVREKMEFFSGSEHKLTISGSADPKNNNTFTVVDVSYSGVGSSIEITLNKIDEQSSSENETLTLSYSYTSPWEVLNSQSDYIIQPDNHKIIQFTDPPQFNDQIYVVHRGEGTYNLVPSPKSVGPEQLQENLRNFRCDRYTGDGTTTTFVLSGTENQNYRVVNAKTLLVTVDGVVKESDYERLVDGEIEVVVSDWKLDDELNGDGKQTITFTQAPTNTSKIRILHLGFSTVSRREVLSPGQIGGLKEDAVGTNNIRDGAVTTEKIANSAVTASKLAANSITDTKILLDNNKSLRAKKTSGTPTGVIKLDANNITAVEGETQVSVTIADAKKHNFTSTEIAPETTNEISLGTSNKRFKDLNLSGVATIGSDTTISGTTSLDVKGDIAVNGTVDGVDVSALKSVVDQLVTDLPTLINAAVPVGTMMMWTGADAPNANWLPCDGRQVSRTAYPVLFNLLNQGATFGVGDGSTTFNLPDMRRRFAVGALTSSELGNNETPNKTTPNFAAAQARVITHTHTGAAHTHDLGNHTHVVPGHNHAVDSSASLVANVNRFRLNESGAHQTTIDISHGHSGSKADTKVTGIVASIAQNDTNLTAYVSSHDHNFGFYGGFQSSGNGRPDTGSGTGWDRDRKRTSAGTTESSRIRAVSASSHGGHDNGTGDYARYTIATAPESTGGSQVSGISDNSDGCFDISVTGSGNLPVVFGSEKHGHTLNWTDNGHDHTLTIVGLSGASALKSDSVTSGRHRHEYTDFAGRIGKLTTYTRSGTTITPSDGDADFSTAGPSTNSTGAASYGTNVSGDGVSPHLIVNYMIKVL